jgi:hypothetical protein
MGGISMFSSALGLSGINWNSFCKALLF